MKYTKEEVISLLKKYEKEVNSKLNSDDDGNVFNDCNLDEFINQNL